VDGEAVPVPRPFCCDIEVGDAAMKEPQAKRG